MTHPVSRANSSFYDVNAQLSSADACDASIASCGAAAEEPAPAAREMIIPPVVINGDAGAQQLIRGLDEARHAADCSLEAKTAALSCAKAGVIAMAGAATATTVVGAVPAIALTVLEGVSCGKDLRAYYECVQP